MQRGEKDSIMIDLSLISGERKRWRDFINAIEDGEVVVFSVDSAASIDNVRTIASRLNVSQRKNYKYVVEGDNINLRVRISTKHPL